MRRFHKAGVLCQSSIIGAVFILGVPLQVSLITVLLFSNLGATDCPRGFHWTGVDCSRAEIHESSELYDFAHSYTNNHGHQQSGNSCVQVQMAEDAELGYTGDACIAAYNACIDVCSTSMLFNYERGEYFRATNTDFRSQCEDACARGQGACEGESPVGQCVEFRRTCEAECPPSRIFDYNSREYLLLTNADSKCENACDAGNSACE